MRRGERREGGREKGGAEKIGEVRPKNHPNPIYLSMPGKHVVGDMRGRGEVQLLLGGKGGSDKDVWVEGMVHANEKLVWVQL